MGLDSARLRQIGEAVQRGIDDRQLSGAVTVVARREKVVHFEAHWLADFESRTPMTRDALLRLASTTKPVTAVAILILMEEGGLRLSDPVSRYIPEFQGQQMARGAAGSTTVERVPAEREITIRDLLTHSSGLGSGGAAGQETTALFQTRKPTDTLADIVPRSGKLPLDFQPGSTWL